MTDEKVKHAFQVLLLAYEDLDALRAALDVARAELARVTAARDTLREAVWRTVELPNELRFQMGTTFGSTRQDRAYADGWNDLRVALGKALSENADAALATAPAPEGA
jgi:hypothetical protein